MLAVEVVPLFCYYSPIYFTVYMVVRLADRALEERPGHGKPPRGKCIL